MYSRCWQTLEKDEPVLFTFMLGLEKTSGSEMIFNMSLNGRFSEKC